MCGLNFVRSNHWFSVHGIHFHGIFASFLPLKISLLLQTVAVTQCVFPHYFQRFEEDFKQNLFLSCVVLLYCVVIIFNRILSRSGKYWSGVKRAAQQIASSMNGAKEMDKEEADTVNALASLSVRVVQNGSKTDEK